MLTDIFRGNRKSFEIHLVDNCVDNVQNCGLSMGCEQYQQSYQQVERAAVLCGKIRIGRLTEETP